MKDCTFCSMPNCEARNSSSKDKCRLEHPNITLNGLIKKATFISRQLTSGDIPLTLNGEPIDIVDITLEGENGNYYANIKVAKKNYEEKEHINFYTVGFSENDIIEWLKLNK